MKRLATVLPLALILSACAGGMGNTSAPEPPPPPDPTGVYDCWLSVEGMEFGAVLTIEGDPGTYTGTVDSEMGPAPVSNLEVDGDVMTFVVDTPDASVFFTVTMNDAGFSGQFDASGMVGSISAEKR
jgi:hypothetical protein